MGIATGLPAVAAFWFLASVSGSGTSWVAGKGGEVRGSCQVNLPGQPSYTEHVERSGNCGGGRDVQPVEKQAAAKYKVIWKCGKEAGKKKTSFNKKTECSKTREKKRYNKINIYLKKKL